MDFKIEGEAWFSYLDHSMKDLVVTAHWLLDREKALRLSGASHRSRNTQDDKLDLRSLSSLSSEGKFHDYSFVVFPMAKAYEGFLKKIFFDMGLISRAQMQGRHFRIGKSLNPDLPKRYRNNEWVYERLEKACGDKDEGTLAREMWKGWRESRNQLFHYFPKHEKFIDLPGAERRVEQLRKVMKRAVECGVVESSKKPSQKATLGGGQAGR